MSAMNDSDIVALGYLVVSTGELEAWKAFAGRTLGMEVVDAAAGMAAFRMDDRAQRLVVTSNSQPTRYTIGWEARRSEVLDQIAARLEGIGVNVRRGTRAEAAERMVGDLIRFGDPAGNCVEVFVDAAIIDSPVRYGRSHSGFRTGAMGLGHVVLTSPDLEKMMGFYEALGFHLSDYQINPFKAYFYHINARHHSLALIEQPFTGIHHVMIEHLMLDDVGQGLDVAKANGNQISVTLGRHTNDHMTSFYVQSPSPFLIECGWGGLSLDHDNWEVCELTGGPSLWGHDRSWLSPEKFAEAEKMRLGLAAKGTRAPVHVLSGYFDCTSQ
ncbi:MAG: hypothetical protein RL268_20 [Pseudomonadota bacterium]|jgi:2,3-dihydroxybiphenyl 1,2-dioxygenase